MKLSIIDQCPVPAGFTTADAFRNAIELARLADRLGFERYWIAEHHATGAFASPPPEVLIARVGAETSHIRVGSGGVMLPHYSPMKVAMWSAAAAAQLGLPYAFAHFIDPTHTRAAIEYYHSHFKPSNELSTPVAILGISAICAPTDAEAQRMASSVRLFVRHARQGMRGPIPTPEQALAELGPGPLPADVTMRETGEWPRAIIGTPDHVSSTLIDIASVLHVEEVMLVTVVHDHQARLRSHELMAQAFSLKPR